MPRKSCCWHAPRCSRSTTRSTPATLRSCATWPHPASARRTPLPGNLAAQGIDLTAVAILTPQLSEPPALDPKTSMLRIKGFFPGQPVRIDFEMIYQPVGGKWRLFGLSVQPTLLAPAPTAVVAPPVAAKPADKPPEAPAPKKAEPAKK